MKNQKKILGTAAMVCMAAGVLAGCGNSGENKTESSTVVSGETGKKEETEADGNVTELTYWYCWTDKIQENNLELTELFNETVGKEKGIHVTAEYQGTYDECHQKLQAAFVANEMPDVSVMEISSIRRFAENGVIEPLDSYIEASEIDMTDFYDALLLNGQVDGFCYGLPYLRSTPIMYYNNTLLKEAGYDGANLKTWDDLKEMAVAVHEKTGKYGISQYSYIWTLDAFMIEHGSSVLNDDETATNLNSEAGKEVIGFFRDLIDQGVVHAFNNTESDKVTADVQNEDTAIWFSSTGDLTKFSSMADELGFELGVGFIPMEECYGTPTGGCNLVMMSKLPDKKKEAAWEFIRFMTDTEQTVKSSIKTGYLPARKSAGESETMKAYFEEMPMARVALDQLAYANRAAYSNPNYTEAGEAMKAALDAIYINNSDIDATLADLEIKVNKILNQ